jgi:hypothetical protein
LTFSSDIFSGMTMMQRYPFTAATIAKPRPDINISHVTSHKLKYIYIIWLLTLCLCINSWTAQSVYRLDMDLKKTWILVLKEVAISINNPDQY